MKIRGNGWRSQPAVPKVILRLTMGEMKPETVGTKGRSLDMNTTKKPLSVVALERAQLFLKLYVNSEPINETDPAILRGIMKHVRMVLEMDKEELQACIKNECFLSAGDYVRSCELLYSVLTHLEGVYRRKGVDKV